jgi:hypothetical protein
MILALLEQGHAALCLTACLPILVLAMRALQGGELLRLSFPLAFSLGNFMCWGLGLLGCVYLDLSIGRHTEMSLVLLNALLWGVTVGAFLVPPGTKTRELAHVLTESELRASVLVSGVITILYFAVATSSGYFTARTSGIVSMPDSAHYYVVALSAAQYPFFFFVGKRLTDRFFSLRNLASYLILFVFMLLSLLSGGRDASTKMVLAFLSGSAFSGLGFRSTWRISLAITPFLIVILIGVQVARDSFDGRQVLLSDRLAAMTDAMTGAVVNKAASRDSAELFFLRIFEPTGQLVVDAIDEGKEFAGAQHAERLALLFVPRIFVPDKLSLDDGPEVLANEYGVNVTEYTSAPITFMADAYRRGGLPAVIISGLVAGLWLSLVGRWISRLSQSLAVLCSVLLSIYVFRLLYTTSVLGFISAATYGLGRDLLVVLVITWIGRRFGSKRRFS